eukprot:439056_1
MLRRMADFMSISTYHQFCMVAYYWPRYIHGHGLRLILIYPILCGRFIPSLCGIWLLSFPLLWLFFVITLVIFVYSRYFRYLLWHHKPHLSPLSLSIPHRTRLKDEMHHNVKYLIIGLIQIDLDLYMILIYQALMLFVIVLYRDVSTPTISNKVRSIKLFIETWIRCATVPNLNKTDEMLYRHLDILPKNSVVNSQRASICDYIWILAFGTQDTIASLDDKQSECEIGKTVNKSTVSVIHMYGHNNITYCQSFEAICTVQEPFSHVMLFGS